MTDQHRETFTEKIQHVAQNAGVKLRGALHLDKGTDSSASTSESGGFGQKIKDFVSGNTATARSDNPFVTSGSSLGSMPTHVSGTGDNPQYNTEFQGDISHRLHSDDEPLPRI